MFYIRADKSDPIFGALSGECCVLSKKSVPWMNRVTVALFRRFDYSVHVEVCRNSAPLQRDCLIGNGPMERLRVVF